MGRPVTHWQILSREPDALAAFYGRLFQWRVNADNALGYRKVETGSERGIPGGIWPAGPGGHSFVQLFVEVDDVGRYVARAMALGAALLIPPQALPDGGELAIVRDPEGIPFGLMRTAPAERIEGGRRECE